MKKIVLHILNIILLGFPNRILRIENRLIQNSERLQKINSETQDSLRRIEQKVTNSGYIKTAENELLTKIFSGAKIYVDPRDIGLVPHLILDGDWERNITNAWLSVINENDTIFDIGANFGYFSVVAAQQVQRKCRISLFEANPQIISYIEKTMEVNSFSDIFDIQNVALSNKAEKVTLNVLKDFIASSSVHSVEDLNKYSKNTKKLELAESIQVSATTVDLYCKANKIDQVNLIKMDIEGYEDVAYEGMRNTIKSSPNVTMFIEFSKDGYKNPKKFYNDMLNDFKNVYLIDESGAIHKQKDMSYEKVIDQSKEWVMPIFSKRSDLAT